MSFPKAVLLVSLFLLAGGAQAASCTDRDYRGLAFDEKLPAPYKEGVCQFKLFLKNRNDHFSLEQFVRLSEAQIGIGYKDLNWNQGLVMVINDLMNHSLETNTVNKLARAALDHYAGPGTRYILDRSEIDLLNMLSMIETQRGGVR